MSIEARKALCDKLVFQNDSQCDDLMNPAVTQTQLIALLLELQAKGYIIEVTAVRSDHHDDSGLGLHCHANGYAIDCWPLKTTTPGDYVDDECHAMRQFLRDAAASPWLWQIGLAGGADVASNAAAAGPTYYSDDGGDHIHLAGNGP